VQNPVPVIRRILRNQSNRGQRFRRLLAFVGWQVWKRTFARPILVNLFNGYRFLAYPDCYISSSTIYARVPDFRVVRVLRQRLNGGVLIDVGSNVGLFSMSLADKIDHAILFEPNLNSAQRARENIAVNSLNFEVHAIALSDEVGEILLEDRGRASGTNRTVLDPKATRFPARKVPRTTLDHFLEDHVEDIGQISLLKIDVEGHENCVIRGMYHTLTHLRPKMVMFEYLERTDFHETRALFDNVRYNIYCQSKHGDNLIPVSDQPKPLQDLFAFPAEADP
jgi:FkbM family methyltransferase